MKSYKNILSNFRKRTFSDQVELEDDRSYKIEEVGSISFQLESGSILHIDEVLYVPGLRKNLLSVATFEDKGYWVTLMEIKALLCAKGS